MILAFYRGVGAKRWMDRLVSWWDRGAFSHCEIVFKKNLDGSYLCGSSSRLDGGIRLKDIHFNPYNWEFVWVPGDDINVFNYFRFRDGLIDYDYRGLFGQAIRPIPPDHTKRICSHACAEAMGLRQPWRYTPNSLYAYCAMHGTEDIAGRLEAYLPGPDVLTYLAPA